MSVVIVTFHSRMQNCNRINVIKTYISIVLRTGMVVHEYRQHSKQRNVTMAVTFFRYGTSLVA